MKISPKKSEDKPKPESAEGEPPAGKVPVPGGDQEKEKKPRFYNVDNFSVSYSYNEIYFRDINIDWRLNKQYQGALDYNFSNKPKEVKPFAKLPIIKDSKYLKWIKDFNFYPGLKQFGFRSEMNRTYETSRIRNNTLELTGIYSEMLIQTQVQKRWNGPGSILLSMI